MHGEAETQLTLAAPARTGLISDLHIGPEHPDIETRFQACLKEASQRLDVLFILGDLFEFWIGDDAIDLCGYRSAVDALADFIRESSCRVYFMHGNRDFLIGEAFCRETGCGLLADPCLLNHSGTPILLSHGDAYCTDDTEHQKFRALVRDPAWQEAFLRRSPRERLDFAVDARSQSESGKSLKSPEIMDVNSRAIEEAMSAANVRLMIHGHTHRPDIHELRVHGQSAYRIVLGDWFTRSSIISIEDCRIRYAPADEPRILEL